MVSQILLYGIGHVFQNLFNMLVIFAEEWISVHSVVLAIDLRQYTLATNAMY